VLAGATPLITRATDMTWAMLGRQTPNSISRTNRGRSLGNDRAGCFGNGVETTLYVINMTPTGADPAYMSGVWVTHGGACYSIQFLSLTPETRDANTSVAAQAIASFKFGS